MNVGQLKAFLAKTSLPDDAPVLIPGRHSLHTSRAEEPFIGPINPLGQAQYSAAQEEVGPNALLFQDTSSG